jgi:coenzyme F420-reducing hydrogenase delta subunit
MEGRVQVGHRMVAIHFQPNRHAEGRFETAYRLLATLAIEVERADNGVQIDTSNAEPTADFTAEIQG